MSDYERPDDAEPGSIIDEPDRETHTDAFVNGAQPTEEARSTFWEPAPIAAVTRSGVARTALAWFIAAVLGAGAGAGAMLYASDRGTIGRNVVVNVARPPVTNAGPGSTDTPAQVAEAVLPSIAQIQVRGALQEGLGSGVIYSSGGYIITNQHVIDGADEIVVNLPNGESVPATVVGDASNIGVDIAVIKVAPRESLVAATFGSSHDLTVGELAVAIGSPFGLEATVTAGIISALHRNIEPGPGIRFTDAVQTDAPINPGNSGGALANSQGEVIGINSAILGGQGNVGVGFAIPIDIALKVAKQLIEGHRAQLPFLGIQGDNLPGRGGARIREVTAGSAADDAGMRVGDVIVSLDGDAVDSMDALIALLIEKDVGDRVDIVVERDGSRVTLQATLAARPEG